MNTHESVPTQHESGW